MVEFKINLALMSSQAVVEKVIHVVIRLHRTLIILDVDVSSCTDRLLCPIQDNVRKHNVELEFHRDVFILF